MGTSSLVHLSPSTVDPQHVDSCPEHHKSILPLTLDHQRIASTLPQPIDIICGRGSRVSSNPGNHRFRIIVEQRKVEYQCAVRREEKSRITMEVIHQLTQGPRPSRCVWTTHFSLLSYNRLTSSILSVCWHRFMLKDPDTLVWYIVGLDYAKEKVSHALRSRSLTAEERQQRKTSRQLQQQNQRKRKQKEGDRQQKEEAVRLSNPQLQTTIPAKSPSSQSSSLKSKIPRRRRAQCDPARLSTEMEDLVVRMIDDQQRLLASMIRRHQVETTSHILYTPASSPQHSSNMVTPLTSPKAPSLPP